MSVGYLRVHNLPRHVAVDGLVGSTVVVIDVLRATSTICQALASGARDVVPLLEVGEAFAAANTAGRADVLLGGERGGKRIDDFDLGNSPAEYTPSAVAGKHVFITTTNGTRAMHHAGQARQILLASFLNLSAVAASLQDQVRIDILCAGTDGGETGEDILVAGAIVDRLASLPDPKWGLNDAAVAALRAWRQLVDAATAEQVAISEKLAVDLRGTAGGRNLVEIGMDQDIVDCAQIDRLRVVPVLNASSGRITAA